MQSTLCCLVHDPKCWYNGMLGLHERTRGPIQRFHQNFTEVSLTSKSCYSSTSKLCIYNDCIVAFGNSAWMYYIQSSITVNTRQTRNACQSNMASSVRNNPWVHSIAGITCASTLEHVGSTKSIVKM
jgi:hypothetical protein